jgi:hypothetical protein
MFSNTIKNLGITHLSNTGIYVTGKKNNVTRELQTTDKKYAMKV